MKIKNVDNPAEILSPKFSIYVPKKGALWVETVHSQYNSQTHWIIIWSMLLYHWTEQWHPGKPFELSSPSEFASHQWGIRVVEMKYSAALADV